MAAEAVLRRVVVGVLDTNCWVLHARGDRRALVVDPGDEAGRVLAAVADLDVVAVLLTHAHFDHVLAVPDVTGTLGVPVLAHPAEAPVWPHEVEAARRAGHWDAGTATADLLARDPAPLAFSASAARWDGAYTPVADGEALVVGPLEVTALHTPGHTPGGLTLSVDGHLLTGDTLFPGGPGLTGPPLSNFPTIIGSVRRLLTWPGPTRIHPGHGPDTTVAAERPHLETWTARGW
ncbi:MBL fold hydrolase [Sphaerisporangium krabiense]|uniref:Glyoxylase-like metal-dependent hydrolase (Beta-lactamase superfamily II) n=1 Tax=Sphaerisporangium krabiense TaxID=763782 RepID=A0A7W8Z8Q7_9ACTN|nr:MBL fold metallo-hydrolase [Sphaerisporangium krabiense]MBB5629447.1 glyoxylase-like metal-dependent hydrolase (beta-lactamase superfamily II) [Sphaerisporangium krabiense]GII65703.1 MBL fold hydrolase [Sphaerisporangium krabiense]